MRHNMHRENTYRRLASGVPTRASEELKLGSSDANGFWWGAETAAVDSFFTTATFANLRPLLLQDDGTDETNR